MPLGDKKSATKCINVRYIAGKKPTKAYDNTNIEANIAKQYGIQQ